MGFPRQQLWSGWPFPSPGIFPIWGSNLHLLHWQVDSLPLSYQGTPVFGLVDECLTSTVRDEILQGVCSVAFGELLLICWSVERNSLVFFSVFLTSVVQSQSHIQFFATPWTAALKLTV